MDVLPLLTISRLKDARACLRLHRYRYLDGYRPAEDAEVLRFGSLMHAGLEAWWTAKRDGGDTLASAMLAIEAQPCEPFDLAKARALLVGYHVRWGTEPLDVLAIEAPFETDLLNPETGKPSRTWRLAGKVDAIVRDPDGRVLVVEHKTSSEDVSAGTDYWRRLRMDGQVSLYYTGARALGHDVQGCLYDVIRKPALRPLKATPEESRKYRKDGALIASQRDRDETATEYADRICADIGADPDRYYTRGLVVRLESEETEAMYDVWQAAQLIRTAMVTDKHPRNPGACIQYGRTCSFFPVCCGEASLDDAALYRKLEEVHPELASTTAR